MWYKFVRLIVLTHSERGIDELVIKSFFEAPQLSHPYRDMPSTGSAARTALAESVGES